MNHIMQKPHSLPHSDTPKLRFSTAALSGSRIGLRNTYLCTTRSSPFNGGARRPTLGCNLSERKPQNPWRILVRKAKLLEFEERTSPDEVKPSLTFSQGFAVCVFVG